MTLENNVNSPLAGNPIAASCEVLPTHNTASSRDYEIGSQQAVGYSTQFRNKCKTNPERADYIEDVRLRCLLGLTTVSAYLGTKAIDKVLDPITDTAKVETTQFMLNRGGSEVLAFMIYAISAQILCYNSFRKASDLKGEEKYFHTNNITPLYINSLVIGASIEATTIQDFPINAGAGIVTLFTAGCILNNYFQYREEKK